MRIAATVTAAPTPADGHDFASGTELSVLCTDPGEPQSPLGSPPHHYCATLVAEDATRASTLRVGDRIEFEGDLIAITLSPIDPATPITGIVTVDRVIWPEEPARATSPEKPTDHLAPA